MAIELVPSVEGGRKTYDFAELSVVVSNANTFAINTGATVNDVVYRTKDGEELDGPPVEPGEYVAEVVVTKDILLVIPTTYTARIDIVIDEKPATGEFPNGAFMVLPSLSGENWGQVGATGDSAAVTDATKLDYDAESGVWSAPMAIEWPSKVGALLTSPRYTDVDHAVVTTAAGDDFSIVTSKFLSVPRLDMIEYVAGVLWSPVFTLDDVYAALDAGKTELAFEISVKGKCWIDDVDGLRETVYRLVLNLDGLVLNNGSELIDVNAAYDLLVNTHAVSGLPTENAAVTVDDEAVEVPADGKLAVYKGKTVAVKPSDGYMCASFTVDGEDVDTDCDGVYSFTMADSDIAVVCSVVRNIGCEEFIGVVVEDAVYTGEPLVPVVTVIDSAAQEDVELVVGTDYTISFLDANCDDIEEVVEVGEYYVVVTGIGAFGGSAMTPFAVTDYAGDFAAYKTTKIGVVDAMAQAGDSDASAMLISNAKAAIAALQYDDAKPLADQKAAVDAIVSKLATDLASQRSADDAAAKRATDEAEFNTHKTTQTGVVDAMAQAGDSVASAMLISNAKAAIAALQYDDAKPLADQKAAVDAIVSKLTTDLANQRSADDAAAAFEECKMAQSGVAESMAQAGDSPASAALIEVAQQAIAALQYDTTKTLVEQQMAVEAIVAQLAIELASQRSVEYASAAFEECKMAQSGVAESMAQAGDSLASAALIDVAQEAIAALQYDTTKTLAEQEAAIEAIVAQLAIELASQRSEDASSAAFEECKTAQSGVAESMAQAGDSPASAALIDAAQQAIAALQYDTTKTLAEQAAAVEAIVEQLATDLATQRKSEKKDAGFILYETVTDTVDISVASKWTAYLRDDGGNVAGSVAINVGKANRRTGISKVKVVVTYPGGRAKLRIKGTMDSSGKMTVGDDTLIFGADAVKGVVRGCDLDGSRNLFASKNRAEKAAANADAAPVKGNYAIAWGDAEGGWNSASVRIAARGRARLSGWTAGGKKFSVSGQFAFGDEADSIPFVSTKKASPVAVNMWFVGGEPRIEVNGFPTVVVAARIDGGAALAPSTLFSGFMEEGIALEANRARLSSKSPKASITVNRKTGRISGSFRVGKKSVAVRGYMVDGTGYGFTRMGKTIKNLKLVQQ